MIKKLIWDSEFFGYSVGCVTIESDLDTDSELFKNQAKKFQLVYIFSKVELLNKQFNLVDEKILLSEKIELSDSNIGYKYSKIYTDIRDNYEQLLELAFLSGKYSRFKIDPDFKNNEFENLYTRWLNNGIEFEPFSQTLIIKDENKIKGFVSLKKKDETTSEIGLIAANQQYQRQGVASQLLEDAEILASRYGSNYIQVATQNTNSPALSLYLKNGYKLTNTIKIYHLWNK